MPVEVHNAHVIRSFDYMLLVNIECTGLIRARNDKGMGFMGFFCNQDF